MNKSGRTFTHLHDILLENSADTTTNLYSHTLSAYQNKNDNLNDR